MGLAKSRIASLYNRIKGSDEEKMVISLFERGVNKEEILDICMDPALKLEPRLIAYAVEHVDYDDSATSGVWDQGLAIIKSPSRFSRKREVTRLINSYNFPQGDLDPRDYTEAIAELQRDLQRQSR